MSHELPTLLLIDNGSSQAEATLSLRRLARRLSHISGQNVSPVSLQHAHKIPAKKLDGRAARTLEPFLREMLAKGIRNYLAIPLFFGRSKALTSLIPDLVDSLASEFGPISFRLTDELYPLSTGEPRLAQILYDQIDPILQQAEQQNVILVDHGSPLAAVTEARVRVAEDLRTLLPTEIDLQEAVMERRSGTQFDFNGELLEQVLERAALASINNPIVLSLLFLLPGRHAGSDGDIASICLDIEQRHPGLSIHTSQLVSDHPVLVDILYDRLKTGLEAID
ncbi:MAG: cobalamin biosynthesis protein CbiX [Candidatus Thiodiazotropha sp. (ex Lucinoma kastoroae)]|nr:cobalamin biosynthesis protein CbiX [Candidatus Thiodiazotropha sp. (ex Lucinoma kastoroae)]MCU7861967.1 cobalamin biosynthesis protein CbiX [Candidatus Thiodiazotropha sp. (ex Lucinoma kastoroae)]